MHNIFESLLNNLKPMEKLMPLKAIWFDKDDKVVVELENGELKQTIKIEKGMHVRIQHGTLLDVRTDAPANYTVSRCMGNIFSTNLEIELIGNDGSEYKLILK